MNIKLSEIRSEGNVRQDLGDLTELTASIAVHGVLSPLTVKPNGKGYVLLAGHRRYAAAKKAGLSEVPVHVIKVDPADIQAVQLAENLHRKDLTPHEVSQTVLAELKRRGFVLDNEQAIPAGLDEVAADIAAKTGASKTYVKQMARLAFLPKFFADLFAKDNLTVPQALRILSLPPEKQAHLAEKFYPFHRLTKPGDYVMTAELESFIDKSYGKRLDMAPFDLDDPMSVGLPCTLCSWNTANSQELFGTEQDKGVVPVCRLTECYRKKCQEVGGNLRSAVEAKLKTTKSKVKFLGYVAPQRAAWDDPKLVVPQEVKGQKVIKDQAKAEGYVIVRGAEGFKPQVAWVGKPPKAKAEKAGPGRDYWPHALDMLWDRIKPELADKPVVAALKKRVIPPQVAALYAMDSGFGDKELELVGAGEVGDKAKKPITWEELGRVLAYGYYSNGNEAEAKEWGVDVEKIQVEVEKKLTPYKAELMAVLYVKGQYGMEPVRDAFNAVTDWFLGKRKDLPRPEEFAKKAQEAQEPQEDDDAQDESEG